MANEIIKAVQPTAKQRKRPAQYIKPQALIDFENAYNEAMAKKTPHVPAECRARYVFRDDTANKLTQAIIAHLRFNGYFAGRVNTTGVYDFKRGLYRTTSARKGMADISATIAGRSVQFEIKAGKDRPRTDQLAVQREVRRAGGVYEFVHTFAEYIELYNRIKEGRI